MRPASTWSVLWAACSFLLSPVALAAEAVPGVPGTVPEPPSSPAVEAPAEAAEPDAAADLYLGRCAGCHTLGGGDLLGPDLEPSTAWARDDLAIAVERMEKNVGPLSDEQVGMLVDLLKSDDVQGRLAAAREAQVREMAATLEPPSPTRGRALFHGDRPFRRGGLACSACHRAGAAGGTLAADLTDAASRLGEDALLSAAATPGFPLMKAAYAGHPVTRQEAVHVTAYLQGLEPPAEGAGGAASVPVEGWGGGAAVAFLIALTFLYRDRVRGVRAPLVREASRR